MESSFTTRSDQWDIRLNVTGPRMVNELVQNITEYAESTSVKYIHVSGIEIGDAPGS